MNILINNYCNQKCPYCFAYSYMDVKNTKDMSFANFKKVLEFLRASKDKVVRFEGGEATLHPLFMDFVDYALSQKFCIVLFTNGLFEETVKKFLCKRQNFIRCTWNLNPPELYTAKAYEALVNNLKVFSHQRSTFGVNIYSIKQNLSYMFEFCKRFRPELLRYVFAHQFAKDGVVQVVPLNMLRSYTPKIMNLVRKVGKELGIPSFFDCGFIPCAWTDEGLATLFRYGAKIQGCDVCLCVNPDLDVAHCFHFDDKILVVKLADFLNKHEIADHIREKMICYKDRYLFRKCIGCLSRKLSACDGGCLGDRKWQGVYEK